MKKLNRHMTSYTDRPVTVIQFGEGNFLRAFVDYMIDIANEKGLFNGNIVLIKPIEFGTLDRYKAQDCQYTVQLRGRVNGNEYVETRQITSVKDIVSPFDNYEEYISLAKLDTVRYVVSNTTEAGIVYNEKDLFEEKLNVTFPAKLTQFLLTRYEHFNGAMDKGLVMLPVELIDDNGIELKRCVKKYIKLWNLSEEFEKWVDEACIFTSTLVDRIVTGYPFDEAEDLWKSFGYKDEIMVTAEPFALWVIESEKDISKEFPLDKALEGFAMFALNQGEICTCPSRALVQESIADEFLARAVERVQRIKTGHPLDTDTMIGAQASQEQQDKILGCIATGREEGAQILTGGEARQEVGQGFYIEPTIFKGTNDMKTFQDEIFGPVLAVATFKDFDDAIKIANDTIYGLGAGVWSRSAHTSYRAGRAIQAGRVWTNCYHIYPAHAAFGGYKKSGIGRENHRMMLDHYQQTKNLLVSYSTKPAGFF